MTVLAGAWGKRWLSNFGSSSRPHLDCVSGFGILSLGAWTCRILFQERGGWVGGWVGDGESREGWGGGGLG